MHVDGTRQLVAALVAGHARVSHGEQSGVHIDELQSRASRAASGWRGATWGQGDVMILAGVRGLPLLSAILGVWSRDAVPLPCETMPDMAVPSRAFTVTDEHVRCFASGQPDSRLQHAAILHSTSGSTGTPNLVKRSATTLAAEAERYAVALDLVPDDRVLIPLPIWHSFGWGVVMGSLMAGCHLDLRPNFSPRQVARAIDAGWPTIVALTPAMAQLLVRCPGRSGASRPRAIFAGAGPASDSLQAAFRDRFGVGLGRNYGSTETGATFSGGAGLAAACIGAPMTGVVIKEPPRGGQGEMILELTPAVDGYVGMAPTALWRTGDIVTRSADDHVTVLSRTSDALRINGRTLDRSRIHEALMRCPGVEDVCLIVGARAGAHEVDDLWAVVQTRTRDLAALRGHIRDTLPVSHRPNRIRIHPSLPRTAVGKIDKQAILRSLFEG